MKSSSRLTLSLASPSPLLVSKSFPFYDNTGTSECLFIIQSFQQKKPHRNGFTASLFRQTVWLNTDEWMTPYLTLRPPMLCNMKKKPLDSSLTIDSWIILSTTSMGRVTMKSTWRLLGHSLASNCTLRLRLLTRTRAHKKEVHVYHLLKWMRLCHTVSTHCAITAMAFLCLRPPLASRQQLFFLF